MNVRERKRKREKRATTVIKCDDGYKIIKCQKKRKKARKSIIIDRSQHSGSCQAFNVIESF